MWSSNLGTRRGTHHAWLGRSCGDVGFPHCGVRGSGLWTERCGPRLEVGIPMAIRPTHVAVVLERFHKAAAALAVGEHPRGAKRPDSPARWIPRHDSLSL